MQRNPQAKSQATILAREMNAAGIPMKHQQALELVAKMSGFRDWNAMAATPVVPATPAAPVAAPSGSALDRARQAEFSRLAWDVINSSDNTGCDEDLTVTSESSVNSLQAFVEKLETPADADRTLSRFDPTSQIAIFWSVGDLQEVRPDLTAEEALNVLHYAKRKHDAEQGINWDVLRSSAEWCYRERELACTLEFVDDEGKNQALPAVIQLAAKATACIEGKPLVAFTRERKGVVFFSSLPGDGFPVEFGKLFGNEDDDVSEQNYNIQDLLEQLKAANALPDVTMD
jgi:hypothetical protein